MQLRLRLQPHAVAGGGKGAQVRYEAGSLALGAGTVLAEDRDE